MCMKFKKYRNAIKQLLHPLTNLRIGVVTHKEKLPIYYGYITIKKIKIIDQR